MELQIRQNPVLNQVKRPISSSLVLNSQVVNFGGRFSKQIKSNNVGTSSVSPLISVVFGNGRILRWVRRDRKQFTVVSSSSSPAAAPFWDSFVPEKGSKAPSLSDIIWPSAGAFAAMAIFGKLDLMLASKGISITIAPLGAVCAVLFATPSSPGARKYNMFMAQIGCAAIGVLAFTLLGPGWLARSSALSAAIAFMIYTRSVHPPAASLPLLFIDGVKMHHLNYWYALFPGAAGCIILCLIQEAVSYLKDNFKF